jgi:NAD(P)-dependent dehydrogenase (short-subunit alcohol dehydrogenase family)
MNEARQSKTGGEESAAAGRFSGKVVVVTGAARGIGSACSEAFSAEGGIVVLVDRRKEQLGDLRRKISRNKGIAKALSCDVSNPAEVSRAVTEIVTEFGSVDILVNNAGVLKTTTPLEKIDDEEWDLLMNVNVKGMYLFSKHLLPVMREKQWGSIINISSSAGRSTSELGGAHYTASKAAVLGLTRHMAREYGQHGITVNAICPGLVETPMIREQAPVEKLEFWLMQIPVGRFAEPGEVAHLVLFLASAEARYINGATIDFNGGSLLL